MATKGSTPAAFRVSIEYQLMPNCRSCDFLNPPGTDRCMNCGAGVVPASVEPGNETNLECRLRSLLEQGQKIEAIKLCREETGASLAEAKDAVEALEAGRALSLKARSPKAQPEFEEVLALLEQRKKIQAIKVYREKTGTGLKDAKEAVEAMAEKHNIQSGYAGVIFFALAVIGVFASLAWQPW